MCGMDKNKQILDLWLEVIYHRELIQQIFKAVPWAFDPNEEMIKRCVEKAREEVLKKFPNLGVTFEEKGNNPI